MGRRSINTTKSGKYMNPTDQARKEARKQELKKNKKQRQMVRAAVLKGKDPQQLLEEMEKIDQMEFNVHQPSPLNEKVLKDKRKKLRDTLDRVLSMYYKDDPEKWTELKRKQTEYEHKKNQLVAFYESVKSAQQVSVDEIPLPQAPQQPPSSLQIPLPTEIRKPEHTIYSIATALKLRALGQPIREPPGCPPGPPPEIHSDGEVEVYYNLEEEESTKGQAHKKIVDEDEDDSHSSEEDNEDEANENIDDDEQTAAKPTSLQQKMVAISGQNVDEFMKEMEKMDDTPTSKLSKPLPTSITTSLPPVTAAPVIIEPIAPPGVELQLQKPLLMRAPPGPPPGRPLFAPPAFRMPTAPAPHRMLRLPGPPATAPCLPVLTAAPQLIAPKQQGATISAKPQIRNLSADVTRFVPSTLRVKREEKMKKNTAKTAAALVQELRHKEQLLKLGSNSQPTKDDAYMQFMKEMQGLL